MSISIPSDAQLAYTTVVKGDPKVEWAILSVEILSTEEAAFHGLYKATADARDDLALQFSCLGWKRVEIAIHRFRPR